MFIFVLNFEGQSILKIQDPRSIVPDYGLCCALGKVEQLKKDEGALNVRKFNDKALLEFLET